MTTKNRQMRIMGIDPGLAKAGWGVIEVGANNEPSVVDFGCITTEKNTPIACRLNKLYTEIQQLIKIIRPEEIAIEKIFFSGNVKTAIDVAQARGVILLALNHSNIKIYEYTPLEIKQAVVGHGRAEKKQVQFMVKQFLKLKELPASDHASDALAAALCHNSSRKLKVKREK